VVKSNNVYIWGRILGGYGRCQTKSRKWVVMGDRYPAKVYDNQIKALVARSYGIRYDLVMGGQDVLEPLTQTQFSNMVNRDLERLIERAHGRDREILEELRDNPDKKTELFRMPRAYLEAQVERVQKYRHLKETQGIKKEIPSETQRSFYNGTILHPENVDILIYHAFSIDRNFSNNEGLDSFDREHVVNTLRSLPVSLTKYVKDLGLQTVSSKCFNGCTLDLMFAFDREYQRRTGDTSLFDLTQEAHLHTWDFYVKNGFWRDDHKGPNKEKVREATYHIVMQHILGENNSELNPHNWEQVIKAIGNLPDRLTDYFCSTELKSFMQHGLYDKTNSPLAVLIEVDLAFQEATGKPSLFDPNQYVHLSEEGFTYANSRNLTKGRLEKPRVLRNRLYHPQCANNGTLITLEDFAQEVRAVEATGASLFLGDILSVAARTGQTPQLLLDARDAFPGMRWDKLMEVCGINYEAHIPSDPSIVDEENTTAFKRLGGLIDNIISPIIPSLTFIFDKEDKCLTQRITDEEQVKYAELLAPDFKPTKTTDYLNPQITYGGRNRHKYYAATKSIPLLDKLEDQVVLAKDIMYFELKARKAFQDTAMTTFYEYTALRAGAINHFVEHNLRLVLNKARKSYASKGVPFDELREAGNAILRRAVVKFDYTKGYKFSTYADAWLRNVMGGLVKHYNASVAVQYSVREMQRRIQLETQRYIGETSGKHPSTSKLSEITGLTTDQIEEARQARPYASSLQERIWGDDSSERMELIEDTTAVDSVEVSHVSRALDRIETLVESCSLLEPGHPHYLSPKEELILRHRLGGNENIAEIGLGIGFKPRSLRQLGKDLGVSRERIRQIEKDPMKKFKAVMMIEGMFPEELVDEQVVEQYKAKVRLFRKEQAEKRKRGAAAKAREQSTAEVIQMPQADTDLEQVAGF
jgi:RNA polymerase sigma factor (sigma-70 family)